MVSTAPRPASSLPSTALRRQFQRTLLRWFDANKRDLPWRADRDPYRVWVSEIMLQQTRVAVVVDYYERFLQQFPNTESLARAREASVLAAWSGLGYYRRARGLHATARVITNELGGAFPRTAKELQQLPGIGKYTAAAIASIAFDEACAVVDGNVERVLSRVFKIDAGGRRQSWDVAQYLLDPKRPGDFNQAMMEMGATICTPVNPLCHQCPVSGVCETRGPVRAPEREVRNKRDLAVVLATRNQTVCLVQRPASERLMPAMWELPEAVDEHSEILFRLRHSITNTDFRVSVVQQKKFAANGFRWVRYDRVEHLPLTGLTRKILRKAGIIKD